MKTSLKPFAEVEIGDIATTPEGEEGEVLAIGYGKDFALIAEYDESGAVMDMKMDPSQYGMSRQDFNELELIAIRFEDEDAVFTYDYDGAYIEIETEE